MPNVRSKRAITNSSRATSSPPPLAEEGQGGGTQYERAFQVTPSPPLPRKRGREHTEIAARAHSISLKSSLRSVESLGIELAQELELLVSGRLGDAEMGREVEGKPGVVLKRLAADARIERDHLHAPLLGFESEHREIGHHAEHAASKEAAASPRLAAAQVSGTGDEIDMLDEAALLVLHRHDHLRERGDVVAAPRPRQSGLGPRRIADERAVQIAVLVDLRAAHESDVDVAALQ